MEQVVAVLGHGVVPSDSNVVGADDLGLTRGDGCFDATRVRTDADGNSTVDNLDLHLARLSHSVEGLGDPAIDPEPWRALVADAVTAWTLPGEAVLKLMYTRGCESVPTPPVGLLTVTPLAESAIKQRDGMSVVTVDRGMPSDAFENKPWLLGGVKTISYAVNMAAKREAARRGADYPMFVSTDGYCLEGPTSALIAVFGNELVTTPRGATGVLASITQQLIFDAAQAAGWQVSDRLLRPEELKDARTSVLVSSVRGVAPIDVLDGTPLPVDDDLVAQLRTWCDF